MTFLKGQNPQGGPARRTMIAALVAAATAAALGVYRFTNLMVKHYAPTPYDDLLAHLTDREQAARLGAKVTGAFDARREAATLRAALGSRTFTAAATADIAAGRMTEVDGWVLPQTVVLLSALASRV